MSEAEDAFLLAWRIWGDPERQPEREYKFHSRRKWLADFAWPAERVLVEVEGMFSSAHTASRHRSITGFINDCEKYNAAAMGGWAVYRVPTTWLSGRTYRGDAIVADILKMLDERKAP